MPVDLIDGTFTVPPEAIADYLSRRERWRLTASAYA